MAGGGGASVEGGLVMLRGREATKNTQVRPWAECSKVTDKLEKRVTNVNCKDAMEGTGWGA